MDATEKALVRRLQQGLPLVPRPYEALGREVGCSEEEVLRKVADFLATGVLRRLGAALKHQRVGYVANAMVVWQVPEEAVVSVGLGLASFPEVTHCYQRATAPTWPYNLYTVIHGQSREEALAVASRLAGSAGLEGRYRVLFSTAELKKSSMRYFV
ncbi:MAG: Lrp/AsnC family transcriptional regulator [Firmicutes bacterium]|nr:Lrp/AsnC family transcriptional regulator [Bacillota bacterium]